MFRASTAPLFLMIIGTSPNWRDALPLLQKLWSEAWELDKKGEHRMLSDLCNDFAEVPSWKSGFCEKQFSTYFTAKVEDWLKAVDTTLDDLIAKSYIFPPQVNLERFEKRIKELEEFFLREEGPVYEELWRLVLKFLEIQVAEQKLEIQSW